MSTFGGLSMPAWFVVEGVVFSRAELTRTRPAWWWRPRVRDAWRGFRIRLQILETHITSGSVDDAYCWAELRLYLQGDSKALQSAVKITDAMLQAKLNARLLSLKGVKAAA